MTISCQRILTEMGNRAWSGFNRDDMIFGNEDAISAQTELNVALRYLINLDDFPFKRQESEFVTRQNYNNYSAPEGQVAKIIDLETNKELTFIGDVDNLDPTKTGTPDSFYFDYSNPEKALKLYPIPDKRQKYKIVYDYYKPVTDKDFTTFKYEFENADDVINMPDDIAYLFMDCLVLRTMITNNKDEQDENYRPTINEFNEHWRVFKKACKPTQFDTYIMW